MKIYGHTHVTALPLSPYLGQTVLLSPDTINGDLLYFNGVEWESLALTVYSNYRPDVVVDLTISTPVDSVSHNWTHHRGEPTSLTGGTLAGGTTLQVYGTLGAVNPYPKVYMHFSTGAAELSLSNSGLTNLLHTQTFGYNNTNQLGITQANALTVYCGDINSVRMTEALTTGPGNGSVTSVYIPLAIVVQDTAWASSGNLSVVDAPIVTAVGEQAFYGCTNLTTVSLPQVVTVGTRAFEGSGAIPVVVFPDCVTIGDYCFANSFLESCVLPVVGALPANCFSGCQSLTSVSAASAAAVGSRAFEYCIALTIIYLPNVIVWDSASPFAGVVGNTISLTIKTGQQVDPAITELMANNTVNITLV